MCVCILYSQSLYNFHATQINNLEKPCTFGTAMVTIYVLLIMDAAPVALYLAEPFFTTFDIGSGCSISLPWEFSQSVIFSLAVCQVCDIDSECSFCYIHLGCKSEFVILITHAASVILSLTCQYFTKP